MSTGWELCTAYFLTFAVGLVWPILVLFAATQAMQTWRTCTLGTSYWAMLILTMWVRWRSLRSVRLPFPRHTTF